MKITIPELACVLLIGPSGAGKSTFAQRHFLPTEVLSSDRCRGLVSDDETSQAATPAAFEVLNFILAKRLAAAKLTVIDATNVQPEARRPLIALARQHHCQRVAIVFDLPESVCAERNRQRPERNFGRPVIHQQAEQLRRSLRLLEREKFRRIYMLRTAEEVAAVTVHREPLWCNLRHEHGPFDIIGDVHGCGEELRQLLAQLGYEARPDGSYIHPAGRRLMLVGDLVDRGPQIAEVLHLVMASVRAGTAWCVPGNHDAKLLSALRKRPVQIKEGLQASLDQVHAYAERRPGFVEEVAEFLDRLVSHYVLDDGNLVVAHAGMKEEMQGRASGAVRGFALYGETTGETDEYGLPVRGQWAAEYRGKATVVYGHTPVAVPEWLNRTINIDTGCVFGGHLTALRYPERELVSVRAQRQYWEPARPFLPIVPTGPWLSAQQQQDEVLELEDVQGKRIISTRFYGTVTIREENAAAALEVMSRFAANPKWLIYLPPTMSPPETSAQSELLEHPAEAFAYYRKEDVATVICEQKHMGSRAVLVVCRDEAAARQHFGVEGESGIIYTRTGRRFFEDAGMETALLERVRQAVTAAGLWEELAASWVCLDAEILPWNAKAQTLVLEQYAAVGAAATGALAAQGRVLEQAAQRGLPVAGRQAAHAAEAEMVGRYVAAYGRYCRTVRGVEDVQVAPFHLLAAEGQVFADRPHTWHIETLARLAAADAQCLVATPFRRVELADAGSEAEATAWWEELTAAGGEGMVVKPLEFLAPGRRRLAQPAVKCRGREYLRIIYGPTYTAPENLKRLRERHLGVKRSLALREFALGLEGLTRFVDREPLRRVHECVFGVLALESEPVDPRL